MLQPGASSRPTQASKSAGITPQTGTYQPPRPAQRQKRKQQGPSPETATWAPPHKRPPQPQGPKRQIPLITQELIDRNSVRSAAGEDKGDLQYQGEIRFPRNTTEAQHELSELLRLADSSLTPVIVGFDSETPVIWVKDDDGKWRTRNDLPVALLQLSYHPASSSTPVCLLLHLSALGFDSKLLVKLLQHPNILKVGMGVAADMNELQRDYEAAAVCSPQGLLDLNMLAAACGVHKPPTDAVHRDEQKKQLRGIKTFNRRDSWSLAGLLQHTTGYGLFKSNRITRSDWAQQPLSRGQLNYAAADAFASLLCCMALQVNWQQQQQQLAQQQLTPQQLMQQQLPQQVAQQQFVQQQPSQQLLPDELIDAKQMGLWELSRGGSQDFQAAIHSAQQPWVDLLQLCCSRTGRMLQQMKENSRLKAELLDHPEWQLGVQYEPGTARSGYRDTPW